MKSITIYRPLKSNILTQGFGDSKACIAVDQNNSALFPTKIMTKTNNTCPIGYVDFYNYIGMDGHNGLDWACWFREPFYFPIIADTEWYSKDASDSSGGLGTDIFSKDPIFLPALPPQAGKQAYKLWEKQGKKIRVKYRVWHSDEVWVDKDVKVGELFAYGDSTGASSGNHGHLGLKFVDENDNTLDKDNGYNGAVDFSMYYENRFILDVLKEQSIIKDIKKTQMSLIDVLNKYIFLLRTSIRSLLANKK